MELILLFLGWNIHCILLKIGIKTDTQGSRCDQDTRGSRCDQITWFSLIRTPKVLADKDTHGSLCDQDPRSSRCDQDAPGFRCSLYHDTRVKCYVPLHNPGQHHLSGHTLSTTITRDKLSSILNVLTVKESPIAPITLKSSIRSSWTEIKEEGQMFVCLFEFGAHVPATRLQGSECFVHRFKCKLSSDFLNAEWCFINLFVLFMILKCEFISFDACLSILGSHET